MTVHCSGVTVFHMASKLMDVLDLRWLKDRFASETSKPIPSLPSRATLKLPADDGILLVFYRDCLNGVEITIKSALPSLGPKNATPPTASLQAV